MPSKNKKKTAAKKSPSAVAEGSDGSLVGNTNSEPKSGRNRLRSIIITWNKGPKDALAQLSHWVENEMHGQYVLQWEEGEMGNPHVQGFIHFPNQVEWNTIKTKWPEIHFEKCKNWKRSKAYCSKRDTRAGKLISNCYSLRNEVDDPMAGLEYKPWQQWIIDMCVENPDVLQKWKLVDAGQEEFAGKVLIKRNYDRRHVYWIYDEQGAVGKTTFCFHLALRCAQGELIYVSGKANDIKHAIAEMHKVNKMPRLVIFNIVRSQEHFISYQAIEEVKDGLFFSGKFDSHMVLMNSPFVLCFANFRPEMSMLSLDRWKITELKE